MPLRHTKGGWMWGKSGPFPTKAKALSVARAAYAQGFKGESAPIRLLNENIKVGQRQNG